MNVFVFCVETARASEHEPIVRADGQRWANETLFYHA